MAAPTGEAGVQEDGAHGDVSRQYDDDDENYEQYINNDVFFNAPIRQDKDSDDVEEEIVDLTRLKCLPHGGKFIPQDYSFGGHDHETSPPNCDIGLTPSSNHFVNASKDADTLKLPRDNESKIFQIEHTKGTQNEHQSDTNVKIDYKKAIYELLEQQLLGPDVMDCHGTVDKNKLRLQMVSLLSSMAVAAAGDDIDSLRMIIKDKLPVSCNHETTSHVTQVDASEQHNNARVVVSLPQRQRSLQDGGDHTRMLAEQCTVTASNFNEATCMSHPDAKCARPDASDKELLPQEQDTVVDRHQRHHHERDFGELTSEEQLSVDHTTRAKTPAELGRQNTRRFYHMTDIVDGKVVHQEFDKDLIDDIRVSFAKYLNLPAVDKENTVFRFRRHDQFWPEEEDSVVEQGFDVTNNEA